MPKARPKAYRPIREPQAILRLLANIDVDPVSGCWNWQGYTDRKGYGQMKFEGRAHWVHRVSHAAFNGGIPDGMTINHTCANPSCCNPDHLETMTVAENSNERWRRTHEEQRAEPSSVGDGEPSPRD